MALRIKLFTLKYDISLGAFDDSGIRRFLANKQLISVKEYYFEFDGYPHIAILLEYSSEASEGPANRETSKNQKRSNWDMSDELDKSDKLLYESLKEWRKERATADGIAVYMIASNKMLFQVVQLKPKTLQNLRELDGFGEAKVKNFGGDIIAMIKAINEEST